MQAGLAGVGAEPVVTTDAKEVATASHVLLPGVGAFGPAMAQLQGPLGAALQERIAADRPTLAICLGLQLLCATSEEAPGVAGLGVLPVEVSRYSATVTVPQMGWAQILPDLDCRILTPGFAYFANSYRVTGAPEGWAKAVGEHGGPYLAAVERGNVVGCQFHPELSGPWGLALLERWIDLEAG